MSSKPWVRNRVAIIGVAGLLIAALFGVTERPTAAAAPATATEKVAMWAGTITTSWRVVTDQCQSTCEDPATLVNTGNLTYTLSGGEGYRFGDTMVHPSTATGSGTHAQHDEASGDCTTVWSVSNESAQVAVSLGIDQPLFRIRALSVPATAHPARPGACGPAGVEHFVGAGGFPHAYPEYDPGNPDEEAFRSVPDTNPDPDLWTGTRTFSATINQTVLKSYTYTITVNLSRTPLAQLCAGMAGIENPDCRASWVQLLGNKDGVRVSSEPANASVQITWARIGKGGKTVGKVHSEGCAGACRIDIKPGTWWVNAQIRASNTLLPSRAGIRPLVVKK